MSVGIGRALDVYVATISFALSTMTTGKTDLLMNAQNVDDSKI